MRPRAALLLIIVLLMLSGCAARPASQDTMSGSTEPVQNVPGGTSPGAATPADVASAIKGGDGADMVLVPAGEFWMGSTAAEIDRACKQGGGIGCENQSKKELPRHRVDLDAFYLDRYEVTNAFFERFVTATGHRTTAEREGFAYALRGPQWNKVSGASWHAPSGPGSSAAPDHPVVQVSWDDASAYCRWAGKRLPTEAEWEKAARSTDGRQYPWGEQWDRARANVNENPGRGTTAPVGSYPNGVSPYGAQDMAGNVWEWVADWYVSDYYGASEVRDPRGPDSGATRIVRGGAWVTEDRRMLRCAWRHIVPPDTYSYSLGFRIACAA